MGMRCAGAEQFAAEIHVGLAWASRVQRMFPRSMEGTMAI